MKPQKYRAAKYKEGRQANLSNKKSEERHNSYLQQIKDLKEQQKKLKTKAKTYYDKFTNCLEEAARIDSKIDAINIKIDRENDRADKRQNKEFDKYTFSGYFAEKYGYDDMMRPKITPYMKGTLDRNDRRYGMYARK